MVNILITAPGYEPCLSLAKGIKLKYGKKITIVSVGHDQLTPEAHLEKYIDVFIVEKKTRLHNIKFLNELILKHNISLILPGSDQDAFFYSKSQQKLNTQIVVSPLSTIDVTRDKYKTYKSLSKHVSVPHYGKDNRGLSYPYVAKLPNKSNNDGVYLVNSAEEFIKLKPQLVGAVFQEFIEGDEVTVDCLANKEGKLIACVPRIRLMTGFGKSVHGKTIASPLHSQMAKRIAQVLKFIGPFNFQTIGGKLIEINPRAGAAIIQSVLSGVNIPAMIVDEFIFHNDPIQKNYKEGYMLRYYEEVFLPKQ